MPLKSIVKMVSFMIYMYSTMKENFGDILAMVMEGLWVNLGFTFQFRYWLCEVK